MIGGGLFGVTVEVDDEAEGRVRLACLGAEIRWATLICSFFSSMLRIFGARQSTTSCLMSVSLVPSAGNGIPCTIRLSDLEYCSRSSIAVNSVSMRSSKDLTDSLRHE